MKTSLKKTVVSSYFQKQQTSAFPTGKFLQFKVFDDTTDYITFDYDNRLYVEHEHTTVNVDL